MTKHYNESDTVTRLMINEVSRTKVLTREEEQVLFREYETAEPERKLAIRNKIVQANLRFVLKIAIHYNKMLGVDINDLMTEGKIGLLTAVDKFKVDQNNKFISYAVWQIRCKISKFLEENDLIRLPPNKKMRLNKLRKEDPSKLDDESKVLLQMMSTPTSLDSPIHEESDLYLKDILADDHAPNGETQWMNSRLRSDISNIMENVLNDEEKFIITNIFGLNDTGETMSLREATETIGGKSRERIRQIRDRALSKLKRNMEIQELNELVHEAHVE